MKLVSLTISNFQSFGPKPTTIELDDFTFFIGPNGSGKTAALQALCRLFAFDPKLRKIQKTDFHVSESATRPLDQAELWIEATFSFPEFDATAPSAASIPAFFTHMRLTEAADEMQVRFRLEADLDFDGEIVETLYYVHNYDDHGKANKSVVPKTDRHHIHVHYLPARRDPASHITYSVNTLLGRLLRSIVWKDEAELVENLGNNLTDALQKNSGIQSISHSVSSKWEKLHKGNYFKKPQAVFGVNDLDCVLKQISLSFTPGHDEHCIDFSRLSDGQKSLLYLSLVLSSQTIGEKVLKEEDNSFDPEKLRPPVFTIIAMEEPENSLAPHYLGRIITALKSLTTQNTAQAMLATHAPSILKRINPNQLRYLRLSEKRETKVKQIHLPEKKDAACKYIQEAVKAYPEIYFARLVILGEGDSELLVLPRLLQAKGLPVDEAGITVAPLGGRHVNHFWKLLYELEIPFVTLLDFDLARYQAGWGRINYAQNQLKLYAPQYNFDAFPVPKWNNETYLVRRFNNYLSNLEEKGVFFSFPLDLDFSMLSSFIEKYDVDPQTLTLPAPSIINSVLGESHFNSNQYTNDEKKLFESYKQLFKLGSKPANHLIALSSLSDEDILDSMPASYDRLIDFIKDRLAELPE